MPSARFSCTARWVISPRRGLSSADPGNVPKARPYIFAYGTASWVIFYVAICWSSGTRHMPKACPYIFAYSTALYLPETNVCAIVCRHATSLRGRWGTRDVITNQAARRLDAPLGSFNLKSNTMKTQCKNIHFHLYNAQGGEKVHGWVKFFSSRRAGEGDGCRISPPSHHRRRGRNVLHPYRASVVRIWGGAFAEVGRM